MLHRRYLVSVFLLVLCSCQAFSADISFDPSTPELGKELTLKLDGQVSGVNWNVLFKSNGTTEKLQPNPANQPQATLPALQPGNYVISVTFTENAETQVALEQFSIESAIDDAFGSTEITKESVSLYLKAKIPGDTDNPATALMMANKLKEIIKQHESTTDKNQIYADLRSGVQAVVSQRIEEIIKAAYPVSGLDFSNPSSLPGVQGLMYSRLKSAFNPWIEATAHLITRLEETTDNASELLSTLNEAVLPALGIEAIPLSEKEPETPVAPLNSDSLIRILQQTRGTPMPTSRSKKHRRRCSCLLLGF